MERVIRLGWKQTPCHRWSRSRRSGGAVISSEVSRDPGQTRRTYGVVRFLSPRISSVRHWWRWWEPLKYINKSCSFHWERMASPPTGKTFVLLTRLTREETERLWSGWSSAEREWGAENLHWHELIKVQTFPILAIIRMESGVRERANLIWGRGGEGGHRLVSSFLSPEFLRKLSNYWIFAAVRYKHIQVLSVKTEKWPLCVNKKHAVPAKTHFPN